MSDGYEDARARRNWLERLGAKIPGFRGFQDRELRRDVDKMQREYLAERVGRIKKNGREIAGRYADAGRLADLDRFDRLDRRLDGLSQAIRFADYGASGFFDTVKVREPELELLYQFDLAFLDDVERMAGLVAAVPGPGDGEAGGAVDAAVALAAELTTRWAERENAISNVVETGAV